MRTNFDKNIARLQFQGADMVKEHFDKLNEEQNAAIDNRNKTISEAAYLNIGSDIHTKRMRKQNAERAMEYKDHFATLALTEALSDCVKQSLLLNTDEYAKLNENYETEIYDTVKGFLENADINENIDNPVILNLYEEILKEVPPADLYLTEEDEKMIVRQHILNNDAIKTGLEELCRDVQARTANIVSKDQESMAMQKDDLDKIDEKELESAPLVSPDETPEIIDAPLEDPDMENEQDLVDPVKNPDAAYDNSEEYVQSPVQESYNPKIIKETVKKGIIETLAINEANKMLSEGKEYNSTLALANALKYVTILETLDASGLVTIGTEGYNRILSASGVDMTPTKGIDIPGSEIKENPFCTKHLDHVNSEVAIHKIELPEEHKETELRNKISDIVRSSMPTGLTMGDTATSEVFKPFAEWKKDHAQPQIQVFDTPNKPIMTESAPAKGTFTSMKGEIFTESELMEYFENQGFNLDLTDFDDLWRSWNFKKN